MSEETKQTEEQPSNEAIARGTEVLRASPVPQSPNTKAAEKKLKEMSRKAKERGKLQNETTRTTRRSEAVIKLNQSWFLGGLGISAILAIGYFIYKSRGAVSEPPPELQPYHYPPPEGFALTPKAKKKESIATPSEKPNSFDLNSF